MIMGANLPEGSISLISYYASHARRMPSPIISLEVISRSHEKQLYYCDHSALNNLIPFII